jgi:Flp pilus assembly protein TadD
MIKIPGNGSGTRGRESTTPLLSFATESYATVIFWLAAGLAAGAAVWQAAARAVYPVQTFELYAERGELLFHAFLDKAASYSMPFFSLLVSFTGYHASGGTSLVVKAALLGIYASAYALGAAGGRRARGLFFVFPLLIMDLAGAGMEAEQIIFTFLVLLYLNLENRRLLRPGPAAAIVSGLCLGMTMLVRSPLFAFPPLAALWEFAAGAVPFKKKMARAALFLVASYVLLVPWIRVNRTLFGQFIPFEQERGSCNIITAVKGSVFTMEGDCRALAGLTRDASVYAWALKEVAARPPAYAAGVAKRLWQVFLMFPVLIPLALIGLVLAWKKETLLPAALAGYFILIHCLLSIEARYFYPLRYLLALLAAAGVFELFSRRPTSACPAKQHGGDEHGSAAPLYAVFSVLLLFALAAEYRLLVYPGRAENPLIAADRELARYPEDPWLLKKKGFLLLGFNRTEEGMDLLARAFQLSGGKESALGYITRTVKSDRLPGSPPPGDNIYELDLVKLLKELDLGRLDAAAGTLDRTKLYWAAERNRLKGVPYERDRAVEGEIRRSTFTWADYDLYQAMFFWPVEKRAKIIDELGRLTAVTPKLEFLREESRSARAGKPSTADENAWSPGADLNYKDTALALVNAVLSKIGPIAELSFARGELHPGGGLPQPLPLVLAAANPLLGKKSAGPDFISGLGQNPDYRELGALIDLYRNAPDTPAFLTASRRLLTLRPGELAPLVIRLAAGRSGSANETSRPSMIPGEIAGRAGAEALSALEKNPRLAVEAAGLAAEQGRAEDALRLCDWALARGAPDAGTGQAAALVYQRLGAYDRALAVLSDAIKKRPGEAGLYNDRGVVLRFLKRDKAAKADFIKALELAPADFPAGMNLAALYAAGGEKTEAIAIYKRLLSLPGSPQVCAEAARKALSSLK